MYTLCEDFLLCPLSSNFVSYYLSSLSVLEGRRVGLCCAPLRRRRRCAGSGVVVARCSTPNLCRRPTSPLFCFTSLFSFSSITPKERFKTVGCRYASSENGVLLCFEGRESIGLVIEVFVNPNVTTPHLTLE